MKKKLIGIILIIIVLAASLFILISKKAKNDNNNKLKTVKVAEVAHTIFYAPAYAAIKNGYFEDEGIKIDLTLTLLPAIKPIPS